MSAFDAVQPFCSKRQLVGAVATESKLAAVGAVQPLIGNSHGEASEPSVVAIDMKFSADESVQPSTAMRHALSSCDVALESKEAAGDDAA